MSFAMRSASSTSRYVCTPTTGPNTSSAHTFMSGRTSVRTVGASTPSRTSPPHTTAHARRGRFGDPLPDPLALRTRDQRRDVRGIVERIADDERVDERDELVEELARDGLVHQHALRRDARLAGMAEPGDGDLLRRRLEVGVGFEDHRRVVPELEADLLPRRRAPRIAQPTSGDPVKVIIAMPGWSTIALPTVPPLPVTTLTHPAGSPHSSRRSSRERDRGERRLARGLEYDGAAGCDRRRHLVRDQVQREVERADPADDADRHAQRERELALADVGRVHGDHLAGQAARLDRGERERRHRPLRLDPRRLDRLGGFLGDDPREFLGALAQQARGAVEDLRALPGRQRTAAAHRVGGGDGGIDLVASAARHRADVVAVER